MSIAIFGGSFDPPHRGHWEIVRRCVSRFEKINLVPARQSPLKTGKPHCSNEHRLAMLGFVCSQFDNVMIDDLELKSPPPSYTIHTIHHIQTRFPGQQISLIIGSDQLAVFKSWHRWQEILEIVKLVVFPRETVSGSVLPELPYEQIDNFSFPVSSTALRDKLRTDPAAARNWIPSKIFQYIIDHKLYRNIQE